MELETEWRGTGRNKSLTSLLWELHAVYETHSVTCYLAEVTFLPLPQLKLVLDLVNMEGYETELIWVTS